MTACRSPSPRNWRQLSCKLARTNLAAADVLRFLGTDKQSLDWYDLSKIHEVIQDEIGSGVRTWITEDEEGAFTAAASNEKVSGDEARHARPKGGMPKRTMTLHEAHEMISLADGWLRSLL